VHAAVDVLDLAPHGDLLERAQHDAQILRSFAAQITNDAQRTVRLRQAALLEELVRYARDRDRALAACVTECARLRARLERAA